MKKEILTELGLADWAQWTAVINGARQQQKTVNAPLHPKQGQVLELGQLNMDETAARVANCQICKLCETRTKTVFGRGTTNTGKVVIVGEGPGEEEDRQGIPFVGRAGKLLDNMLKAIGLDLAEDIYITNIVKCRPPNNRNPLPEEIESCLPYLHHQLELLAPKLIIACGRVAANALIKPGVSMADLRGRKHMIGAIAALAIYHPAYLLRRPTEKRKAWEDLQLLRRILELD